MKVLIVDNTIDRESWGNEDLRKLVRSTSGVFVEVRRAPQRDLPKSPRGFDRIILSGSKTSALEDAAWVEDLHAFIRATLSESVPLLGVCYGHQTIARVLGGKETCHSAQTPEFGWTEIELTRKSVLFNGLSQKFYSFSSHFEEVKSLPSSLKSLARSQDCAIQAYEMESKPVFGIQFHPEKDVVGAVATFAARKRAKTPKHLLHPDKSDQFYDPKIGETIFKNFLELK